MALYETTLLMLLFVLGIGLIVPELLKKFRLPFVTLIIFAGAIFGPNVLGYVQPNEVLGFFGFLGMTFLMLMAGLETDLSKLKHSKSRIFTMAFLNGFIPFLVGLAITLLFGYPLETGLLIGIIFISSSVAVIVPSLRGKKVFEGEIGHLILAAILVADVLSLIAVGFIFQSTDQLTFLPLPAYYILLAASILAILYLVPRVSRYALGTRFSHDEGYERGLRFVIITIIALLAFFSLLGVHPILAAFLAGLALSSVIMMDKSRILYAKVHTLSYGLFIPVFFFVVGMELDFGAFTAVDFTNLLPILLIAGLIASKIGSGYLAGTLVKLKKRESLLFGAISIPQLTTTLAVAYTAAALGLFDKVLVSSVILLAIITTFLGPILTSRISAG